MGEPMAKPAKARVPAIAYLRRSSAANAGADKDSEKRQRLAIEAYAKYGGYELVGEFYDPAVSGADPIETRPGFAAHARAHREQRRQDHHRRNGKPLCP